MNTEPELLNERLERLAIVLDEIMPQCALLVRDAVSLLKEQENLLGIQQTADSITFVSTGTAQQGEERGIMLGKSWMHEWLKKELLHRGLLTDEIRSVFNEAKVSFEMR